MSGEGALGASFIPVFTGYLRDKPRAEAWSFAQKVFWDMAADSWECLPCLGVSFRAAESSLSSRFSRTDSAQWDLAIYLNRIIFPAIFFMALAAHRGGDAQQLSACSHLPAATSIFFNLVLILFSFGVVYRPIMQMAPARFQTPAVAIACANSAGRDHPVCDSDSGARAAGHALSARCVVQRSRACRKSGSLMGPAVLRRGRLSDQLLLVDTIFCDVVAHADREA